VAVVMSAKRSDCKVFMAALDDEDLLFADLADEHRLSVEVRRGYSQFQVR
jgi:hypothetical protein